MFFLLFINKYFFMNKELLRQQRLSGIISESVYQNGLLFEAQMDAVNTFAKELSQSGVDVNDKNAQIDILDDLIDANFDLSKVNPEAIQEYGKRGNIEEAGSAILHATELTVDILDHTESIEKIAHKLGASLSVVKQAAGILKKVIKVLSLPFRLIQKLFMKLARLLGFDLEKSMMAGVGGLLLFGVAALTFAIIHFPSVITGFLGAVSIWSFIKVIYFLFRTGVSLVSFIKNLFTAGKEAADAEYTITDFLNDLEPILPDKKEIPSGVIIDLVSWSDHLKDKDKEIVTRTLGQISEMIKSNKSFIGHMNELARIAKTTNSKAYKDLNDLISRLSTN